MPSREPSRPLWRGPSVEGDGAGGWVRAARRASTRDVDLPAPLGPVTSTVCPAGMSRSTPAQGRVLPRRSRVVDEHGRSADLDAGSPHPAQRPPRPGRSGSGSVKAGPRRGARVSVGGQLVRVVGDVHDRWRRPRAPARAGVRRRRTGRRGSSIAVLSSLITTAGRRAMQAGDGEALELPARQRGRLPVGETGESDPGEQPVDVDVSVPGVRLPTAGRRRRGRRGPGSPAAGRSHRCRRVPRGPADPGRSTVPSVGACRPGSVPSVDFPGPVRAADTRGTALVSSDRSTPARAARADPS